MAQKMIVVIPLILMALNEGRLLIVDELDAKLHPKLLRYIISIFKDKNINKYGAQLVFTSHDIITMRSTVYRRDEIWFAAEMNVMKVSYILFTILKMSMMMVLEGKQNTM